MRSSTKRTKVLNRAGLVLLSVLALVASGTVAWGHAPIAGGGDSVHTCVRGAPPRTLRVVTSTEACTGAEQGLDWPQNGTLIGVVYGDPVATNFTAAAGDVSAPTPLPCPAATTPLGGTAPQPNVAIGATFTQGATVGVALAESVPSGNDWSVKFVAITAGAKALSSRAICVTRFQQ